MFTPFKLFKLFYTPKPVAYTPIYIVKEGWLEGNWVNALLEQKVRVGDR